MDRRCRRAADVLSGAAMSDNIEHAVAGGDQTWRLLRWVAGVSGRPRRMRDVCLWRGPGRQGRLIP